MSAMEKMLSSMLGISTDDLTNMISSFQTTLVTLDARLSNIELQQNEIKALLETLTKMEGSKNDNGNDSSE